MRGSTLFTLILIVTSVVSGWIVTVQARNRMSKGLGRKVKDSELTSLTTWMQVEDAEARNPNGPPKV